MTAFLHLLDAGSLMLVAMCAYAVIQNIRDRWYCFACIWLCVGGAIAFVLAGVRGGLLTP